MLLRELLKVSTNSRYQKSLNTSAPGTLGTAEAAVEAGGEDASEAAEEEAAPEPAPAKKAKTEEE